MKASALSFCLALLATVSIPDRSLALYSDTPQPGQLRINCGSTNLYTQEQYLSLNSGSAVGAANSGLFTNCTVRTANNSAYFGYHIPVASTSAAPLYLSFHGKGQIKASVEGTVFINATAGYSAFAPFEYTLTNSTLWADGYVDVRFDDAVTSDGNGPSVAWVELWASSEWRERMKHVLWDTSEVIWSLGGYDGRENEFRGTTTDFTVGNDVSQLTNSGTILLRWNQTVTAGKQYFILTAVRNVGNSFTMDMNNDGSVEYTSSYVNTNAARGWYWAREVMGRLDITDQMAATNVLKLTLAAGGPNPDCLANLLDTIALVEVTPGHIQDSDLRLVFKGNEQADNWTKLLNTTMFFSGHLYLDWSTGEFRTSAPNGQFEWFGGDSASQLRELARWGYYAPARQAAHFLYYGRNVYTEQQGGVGASAHAATSLAYLMMLDNYTGTFSDDMYPALRYFCDLYAAAIETDSRHLTQETHYEGGGPYHTTADNTATYTALRFGAQAAGTRGQATDATRWGAAASNQLTGINANLILSAPMVWTNYTAGAGWPPPPPRVATNTLPAGTFLYGMNDSGVIPTNAYAGLWTGGHHEEMFFGYRGDSSALSDWRAAMNKMLDYHPSVNFTDDWRKYGDNYGVGTSYGALSEGGGRILTSMLLSDRMDLYQKNLMHVIWNSTDLNFNNARNEETFGEISPWVLVYDIDKQDNLGWHSSEGWDCEDMNGIEYADCMKNARVMAGVDDLLYNGDNLVIIPRLPVSWNEVKVNQWPAAYRNGTHIGQATVTFDFRNAPTNGAIDISASVPMTGVKFRLGPFEKSASVSAVTTNGAAAAFSTEIRGSARWIWVTADINTAVTHIAAILTAGDLVLCDAFDGGALSGWTSDAGTWSNRDGRAAVVTGGSARSGFGGNNREVYAAAADVKATSTSLSNTTAVAGIGILENDAGTTGYRLLADFTNQALRLMKDGVELASDRINLKPNRTYRLKLVKAGGGLDGYLDEVKVFSATNVAYSSGRISLVASNGNITFDNVLASEKQSWVAYNDLAWGTDQPTWQITTNGIATNGIAMALTDYTNGDVLAAQVSLVATNAKYWASVPLTGAVPAGTPAAEQFPTGIVDCAYYYYDVDNAVITFSSLSTSRLYTVAMFANRGGTPGTSDYDSRYTTVAISGADSFLNTSSTGAASLISSNATMFTGVPHGHVFRFDQISPGADGTVSFQLTGLKPCMNALMIRTTPPSTGVPDVWKARYFGSTNGPNTGDFEDYDHDNFLNYAEWRAGTDPTSDVSRLEFQSAGNSIQGATNQVVLTWRGVTGKTYGVWGATNLSSGWSTQQTGIAGISPMNTVTVPVVNAAGFWRVRVE